MLIGRFLIRDENGDIVAEASALPSEKETEANARLIAAAPDLYEACRALVAGFTPETEEGENDPDIAQGLRAIAKAEGAHP